MSALQDTLLTLILLYGYPVVAGVVLVACLGMPLPGPQGQGIARLDQVMKNPEAIRSQFPGEAGAKVIPEEVPQATVHVACP